MRNVATKSIGLKVVIKDSNGNYSTGEWMQNPEKGCPNRKSSPPSPSGFPLSKYGLFVAF